MVKFCNEGVITSRLPHGLCWGDARASPGTSWKVLGGSATGSSSAGETWCEKNAEEFAWEKRS